MGGLYRTSPSVLLASQGHRTQVGYGDARKLARVLGLRCASPHPCDHRVGRLAIFCREVPDHRSGDGRGGERRWSCCLPIPMGKAVMLRWVSVSRLGHSLGHSPCRNTTGQERTDWTTPLT